MEEARTLSALGVEFAQGYHFGYPEPVETWVGERDAGADRGSMS
jgi:EAL domain-containing protein (putative c-di-GMP-specific phosphodiesterase class I)